MVDIFQNVLGMSLTGSILFLLVSIAMPATKRLFSSKWHCRLLSVVLLFFLLPVGTAAAKIINGIIKTLFSVNEEHLADLWADIPAPLTTFMLPPQTQAAAPRVGLWDAILPVLPYIWLGGAVLFLIFKLVQLARFESMLAKSNAQIMDEDTLAAFECVKRELGITHGIALYSNPLVTTPMLMGLIRTRLILPRTDLDDTELELVLRHELTHYNNRDLWVKTVSMLACAAHWFNPCAYLLSSRLDRFFEMLCDADVVKEMNRAQRLAYGAAILGVLSRSSGRPPGVYAAFSSNKNAMKGRLSAMLNERKRSKRATVLAVFVLAAVCVTGIGVSAAAQTETEKLEPASDAQASAPAYESRNQEQVTYMPVGETTDENGNSSVLRYEEIEQPENSSALTYEERERPIADSESSVDEDAIPNPYDFPVGTLPPPTGFLWPTEGGYISAAVGAYPGHTGTDIKSGGGLDSGLDAPVFASAAGIVTKAVNSDVGYGKHIVIDHGNGYQTVYAHCNSLNVSVGDAVEAGQTIAAQGRSGDATGVHLHFEVRYNGRIMNPEDYVNIDNAPMEPQDE